MFDQILGSIAGPLIGGLFGDDAADSQAAAGQASIAEQRRQFDLARADQAPYRQAGGQAVNRLSQMLGLGGTQQSMSVANRDQLRAELLPQYTTLATQGRPYSVDVGDGSTTMYEQAAPSRVDENALSAAINARMGQNPEQGNEVAGAYDFTTDPSYQFRFNEGQKAVNNATAGRGSFLSGAALKAIQKYGQGAASQEYGAQFNRLSGLAGTGQTSVQNTNDLGAKTANNIGNTFEGIGNVQAAASNNWGNMVNQGFQNYNQQNQLGKMLGGGGLQSNDSIWKSINGY